MNNYFSVPSLEESVTVLDYNTNALFLGICNNLFSFPQKDFVILSRFGTSDYSLFNNVSNIITRLFSVYLFFHMLIFINLIVLIK